MSAHSGPGVCPGCLTVPGRDHGVACPAVEGPRHAAAPHADTVRIVTALLVGVPIGAAIYLLAALLIWSLT
ncbi:hypothetical protein [Salinispora sp. H7-4]|uniref:hypothetical protein n=1 Tax=Salinispora sp. H7-4 TaxID=2748321 RepID=UPI0015D21073|nr:hypothetical protein [Salinispora sp. H7-4]NYT96300.1 hypothetical protein [Salinispora sp. H7-4]